MNMRVSKAPAGETFVAADYFPDAASSRGWQLAGWLLSAVSIVALLTASVATARQPFTDWPAFASVAEKLLAYYSYFTIWSTVLCIICGLVLLARGVGAAVLRINAVTMIVVTGIIYNFVLTHDPYTSVFQVTSPFMHTVLPLAIPLVWLGTIPLRRQPDVTWRTVVLSLIVPVVWTVWMFYRGAATGGFYPYSIVDVTTLGYATVIRNVVGVYGLFFGLAGLLALVERLILRIVSVQ
ncbi:Pr6Pr family membrane protein [Corynebacterium choanae]|uniref:Integral membrane protein n=1 Tax=Corynebacterium choanae TaxID=1862358 RepID=A0A3G6J487_9CORY|nr:Pr6Pr family membrane protein [Corynebacterium choanae]AZA12756.1 hypothetical protein CCHOA_01640 [Corynebacterium choanae]